MELVNHPIWKVVKSLMHKHDCVIVPGFGGFVCNKENSRIDQVTHEILPPGKHVVFNPNLRSNDGLLAANLAPTLNVKYNEAIKEIEEWVVAFKQMLGQQKQIEISQFGKFRLNAEANIVFIPQAANRYDFDSFGLSPVQAQPVASRNIAGKSRILKEIKPIKETKPIKSKKLWPSALAITLLGLLAVNGWIFIAKPNKDMFAGSSLSLTSWFDSLFAKPSSTLVLSTYDEANTQNSQSVGTLPSDGYIPDPPVLGIEVAITEDSIPGILDEIILSNELPHTLHMLDTEIAVVEINDFVLALQTVSASSRMMHFPPAPKVTALSATELVTPISTEVVAPVVAPNNVNQVTINSIKSNYHIIAGVFYKPGNAEKYVAELQSKGFEATILPGTNCQRVSVAAFASKNEAENYLNEARSINKDVWILNF
jgi:nucleoid DNA-binding protein/cell division septation protein DedD